MEIGLIVLLGMVALVPVGLFAMLTWSVIDERRWEREIAEAVARRRARV